MTRTASASDLTPGDVTTSATITKPARKSPPRRTRSELGAGVERAWKLLSAKIEANAARYAGLPESPPSRQVKRRALRKNAKRKGLLRTPWWADWNAREA